MTDEECRTAYAKQNRVVVKGHDYSFAGEIITVFLKRDGKSMRCVVENNDRVCLIQSAKNLELEYAH